jgi:TonB family protein
MRLRSVLMSAFYVLSASQSEAQVLENDAIMAKLTAPIYPPSARAARITGDVELTLNVRQDGSIESATVVSGHPLLSPAALDSAQHSQFDCHKCTTAVNLYRLVYTFRIEGECDCMPPPDNNHKPSNQEQSYPQVVEAEHRVTVTAQVMCICDPVSSISYRRSLKCLYLWRCAS